MERKEEQAYQQAKEKVHQVLRSLRKHAPLTLKQEKFCSEACVRRFLKAKDDNVKKAAKQLWSCLAWRDSIGTGTLFVYPKNYLIADEFATDISEGAAYVAGLDDESRPVVVFRLKQDFHKLHHHKRYIRLLVFTMEVTMAYMPRNVEQLVLLFDAGCFKSASACMNTIKTTLSIFSDYYPGRLARAFIIDPPSLFSYLWKGVRPFVDLSTATSVISSLDVDPADDDVEDNSFSFPRTASLRYDSTPRLGSSFRFSFTVQPNDSLKPWNLTRSEPDNHRPSHDNVSGQPWPPSRSFTDQKFEPGLSPALVSPLSVRSLSFASPAARSTPRGRPTPDRRSLPSTPWNGRKATGLSPSPFAGVSAIFRREPGGRSERNADAFRQWGRFYLAPYDEVSYRAKMRPPFGGLISIVSPHFRRRPPPHKK